MLTIYIIGAFAVAAIAFLVFWLVENSRDIPLCVALGVVWPISIPALLVVAFAGAFVQWRRNRLIAKMIREAGPR